MALLNREPMLGYELLGYELRPPQETGKEGRWEIQGPKGQEYSVFPKEGVCTCPSTKVCRHLRLAWLIEEFVPCLR